MLFQRTRSTIRLIESDSNEELVEDEIDEGALQQMLLPLRQFVFKVGISPHPLKHTVYSCTLHVLCCTYPLSYRILDTPVKHVSCDIARIFHSVRIIDK